MEASEDQVTNVDNNSANLQIANVNNLSANPPLPHRFSERILNKSVWKSFFNQNFDQCNEKFTVELHKKPRFDFEKLSEKCLKKPPRETRRLIFKAPAMMSPEKSNFNLKNPQTKSVSGPQKHQKKKMQINLDFDVRNTRNSNETLISF